MEWQLLEESESDLDETEAQNSIAGHDIATAPLMTREGLLATGYDRRATQYGVLGKVLAFQYVLRVCTYCTVLTTLPLARAIKEKCR